MTPILPANMYSLHEVCEFEGIKNTDRIDQLARNTNKILSSKCREMGFPSARAFSDFYNGYSNGLNTDRACNQLFYHSKLQDIAHLFKWVVRDRVSQKGGKPYPCCDFGILKTQYHYYRKHGKPPDVFNRGPAKAHFTPPGENARTKIDLPKTATYKRFTDTIKTANKGSKDKVTIPQMILVCIEEYMNNRPELFGTAEIQVAPDTAIRVKDNDTLTVTVSPETTKKLSALLARYNSSSVLPVTQSQLIEKAILQMIERVPVELSDPELARELREAEHEAQNNNDH